ncbi:hypothetical protein BH10ACI3_BH10ACI3_21780 [soil metagenome]
MRLMLYMGRELVGSIRALVANMRHLHDLSEEIGELRVEEILRVFLTRRTERKTLRTRRSLSTKENYNPGEM